MPMLKLLSEFFAAVVFVGMVWCSFRVLKHNIHRDLWYLRSSEDSIFRGLLGKKLYLKTRIVNPPFLILPNQFPLPKWIQYDSGSFLTFSNKALFFFCINGNEYRYFVGKTAAILLKLKLDIEAESM